MTDPWGPDAMRRMIKLLGGPRTAASLLGKPVNDLKRWQSHGTRGCRPAVALRPVLMALVSAAIAARKGGGGGRRRRAA